MTAEPIALLPDRVFTGRAMLEDHAVVIAGGRIADVVPRGRLPAGCTEHPLPGVLLAPGFIDVQVNGGGGVLFNDSPTVEAVAAIGRAHRRFGTTGFLPTLISDAWPVMEAAMAAAAGARAAGVAGVLGVHLEGPFLSPARPGVHDPAAIRPPDEAALAAITAAARGGLPILLTLAPEAVPPGTIARLVEAGVRVSAGHTAAHRGQILAAIAEGLTGFTHLFNAMTPMGSREPGVVGAALDDPGTWCGLIIDGHHVHPASLRVAIHAKAKGRMMLVTDAMPPVGSDESTWRIRGETISVVDGRSATADGTLAGSVLDMASAVRNAVAMVGVPLTEALSMASANPAAFLGLADRGVIEEGAAADLVALDPDLRAVGTWIGGRLG
jgi:N-acetylglucosamine-6-phosphate deacetylase